MPDLHTRLTELVTATEEAARACPPWPWTVNDCEQVMAADDILVADAFALSTRQTEAVARFIAGNDPGAVLRRCVADRRILERHNFDPTWADWPSQATACHGCGVSGDCDWPVTDNLNDCPELLDMAAAYGLDAEQIAALDRPQPPERQPGPPIADTLRALYAQLDRVLAERRDVPPTFRGPNWKG